MTLNRIASSFFSHDLFNPPNDRYRQSPTRAAYEDRVLGWLHGALTADPAFCYVWPGAKSADGYGLFNLRGKSKGAHIVVCDIVNGPAPRNKPLATHACGNGRLGCANPAHLRWGDSDDNSSDARHHHFMRLAARGGIVSVDPPKPRAPNLRLIPVAAPLPGPHDPDYKIPSGLILGIINSTK